MSYHHSEKLTQLLTEYESIEKELADPAVHADQSRARQLGRRYSKLGPIVSVARQLEEAVADEETAREFAADDPSFTAEAESLRERIAELREQLTHLLLPADPDDDKDVIMEIKAGAGGAESALFAGDLLNMYLRYAQLAGYSAQILDETESDLGGYKSVSLALKYKGTPPGGKGVWSRMKYEGGVHRVQRIPVTETQGRIHTSAAGVLVMPEAEEIDVEIDMNDLRIDVYRSSGPGGQSVNTTDSAVRITHEPTGVVVSCQNEKSQLQNREQALRILRARLLQHAQEEADAEAADQRRSQVRTMDRSERVRTYNFPENRISDHRINYKAHNLSAVLAGDLGAVLDALEEADMRAKLEASGEGPHA